MNSGGDKRLFPLDALRGLIIIFMALDHANYFIARQHSSGEYWGGTFPVYHSALPFLTRLMTHLSAPGFFFLMGVSMLLFSESRRERGWKTWQIIGHFLIRGVVLIALQLFVINPVWKAGPGFFPEIYIGVLIALGGAMILGSLFLGLSTTAFLVLTLVLLVGTEFLHPAPEMWGQLNNEPLNLILIRSGGDGTLWSNYPVLPWLELTVFGFLYGKWIHANEQMAYNKGLGIGITLLLLFVIIRFAAGFGNIRPRAGNSWIDFFNVVKYPPSLTFTFLTMGVNLIVLWGFSKGGKLIQTVSKPLAVFGSVPLFFYVLHLILYMLMGRLFEPNGTSIQEMLPYWLVGLAILYPPALLYRRLKHSKGPLRWITSYL